MIIDETLAHYSDLAFESAFAVLVLAFVLLIVEYASSKAWAVQDREAARELVSAGSSSVADAPSVPGRVAAGPRRRSPAERAGNMGRTVLVVGTVLAVASIVLRGLGTGRFPLGNMYEFVAMACAASLALGLVWLRKPAYRSLWVFVLVPILVLMFLAATVLYADAAPVVPALQSFWLPIHVTIICIGSGMFLLSGMASILYLIRMRHPRGEEGTGPLAHMALRLPDAQTLDRLAYKSTIIAFPLFGAGVILGAIWAEAAWGRFWGWDPKETVSFITWIVYAGYLHARATSGWRDTKAAWINIVGFVAMLFNLFIINMVVSGLHSYAGLN
ncbi:c-type cytochrome biogenesis protein CcsB [Rhodococcus rhodnii]|uniref:Cytochrome c biogenesis protein n=2 Tax=Rhodococcus rhodnii TaxID=38312 RepID=R7WPE3_9NOCA|nr:c-type cytochrome biogenesis protein CcsB [Rhodococcus rhodnii]EOM77183.1 cytochrome c biogenesis protein [Rhodococcus rhodnii LMG 5362]TXG91958.1 c-type cytochrome biogenesis protein CcsB [Rhodococcus rhodnii]